MVSAPQPTVGRDHPYPLRESHMLVLEDTMRAPQRDSRARHIQAAVMLLLAACVLLILIDSLPDHRATARFPWPTEQATARHAGGTSRNRLDTTVTCQRDRVCREGGS